MRTIALEGELNASRRDREGYGYDMRVNLGTIRSALWSQVPFYIFDEPINDVDFFGPIMREGFEDLAELTARTQRRYNEIMRDERGVIVLPRRASYTREIGPGNTSDPVSPGR